MRMMHIPSLMTGANALSLQPVVAAYEKNYFNGWTVKHVHG
jgi:hypothetical protein